MHLQLADRLEIGKPRRTSEGYLAVRARAARSGVYDYLGREVDPEGKHFAADQVVKVYRPESEVFAKDAVHSFLMKPVTDDHPSVAVTADNWRQHAKGVNAGAMRDGEYLAFDLLIMDKATIEAVDSGKRELSNGYGCELDIGDGRAPDGTAYQAVQRTIRGNHIAVVDKARAGSECRISDGGKPRFENCDTAPIIPNFSFDDQEPNMPHVLTIDGFQVPDVSDAAKAAIEKLQGQVTALTTARDAAVAERDEAKKALETKDGEIAALTKKVSDAEVTPEKLQQLADARAKVIAGAQVLKPGITVDGKTNAAICKEAVEHALGDAAKDMSDGAIEGAFAALSKDAKPGAPAAQPIHAPRTVVAADNAAVRDLARQTQFN